MTIPEVPEEIWQKDGFKSSYSDNGGNCVEVVLVPSAGVVAARDTKDRQGGQIVLPEQAWRGLLATLATQK